MWITRDSSMNIFVEGTCRHPAHHATRRHNRFTFGRPFSNSNLAGVGCNCDLAHYSNASSLRVAGCEDEDDDDE
jgi:hypothetical protein